MTDDVSGARGGLGGSRVAEVMKSIRCAACGYAGWWDSDGELPFPCPFCGASNWVTDRKDEIPDPLKAAYSVALSYLDIYGRAVIRIRLRDGEPTFTVLHSLSVADEALDVPEKALDAYARLVLSPGANLPPNRHRRSGWFKSTAKVAYSPKRYFEMGWVGFDGSPAPVAFSKVENATSFDISSSPLEDLAADARDRRLQALEETVSLLLAKQDRMVGKMNKEVDPPLVLRTAPNPGGMIFVDQPIGYPPQYGYSPGMDPSSVKDIRKLQKMTRRLVKAKPPTKREKR